MSSYLFQASSDQRQVWNLCVSVINKTNGRLPQDVLLEARPSERITSIPRSWYQSVQSQLYMVVNQSMNFSMMYLAVLIRQICQPLGYVHLREVFLVWQPTTDFALSDSQLRYSPQLQHTTLSRMPMPLIHNLELTSIVCLQDIGHEVQSTPI